MFVYIYFFFLDVASYYFWILFVFEFSVDKKLVQLDGDVRTGEPGRFLHTHKHKHVHKHLHKIIYHHIPNVNKGGGAKGEFEEEVPKEKHTYTSTFTYTELEIKRIKTYGFWWSGSEDYILVDRAFFNLLSKAFDNFSNWMLWGLGKQNALMTFHASAKITEWFFLRFGLRGRKFQTSAKHFLHINLLQEV